MQSTTDLSTPESRAELAYLRTSIEYAPQNPGAIAPSLVGWWTNLGHWLCARCAGRIIARGCRLPKSEAHWTDSSGPRGVCCCCGE